MMRDTKIFIAIAAAILIIAIILLIIIGSMCCMSARLPPNTNTVPSHEFNHTAEKNITVIGDFDFYFKHDIRVIASPSDNIELKMWGDHIMPDVNFTGDNENLTMTIAVHCAMDNDFGTPYATEYLYLPRNATYNIMLTGENGDMVVGNFSGGELRLVNQHGVVRAEKGNYSKVYISNDGKILADYDADRGNIEEWDGI